MWLVVAYILVICLVQFCLTAGVWLAGFPIALLLAKSPIRVRTIAAGVIGGIAGVAFAVALGYGVFRIIVGPESFTIGPFLASIVPLLIPIRNDYLQWRRVISAREELLATIQNSRGDDAARAMAVATETAHGSALFGEIAGIALAIVWFFALS